MSSRRVYVGGVSSRTRERDLEDVFARYGRINNVDVKNGFAFVEFDDSRDAEDAVRRLDGTSLDGTRLRVEFSHGGRRERRERPAPVRGDYRLLVDGISRDCSWQDLKDVFRKAGDVVFTDVRTDRSGSYVIVEFKRKEDMLAALKDIDGTDFRGKRLSLKEDSASSSSSRRRSRSRSRSPPKSSKRRSHSRSKSRSRSPPRRSRSPPAAKDSNGTKKEGSPAPAASAAADGAGAAADPKSPSAAGDDAKSK